MKNPFSFIKDSSARLPFITLLILLATLLGLLLVGYEHFLSPKSEELVKAEKLKMEEDETLLGDPTSIIIDSTEDSEPSSSATNQEDSAVLAQQELEAQKKEAEAEKVPESESLKNVGGKNHAYTVEKGETFFGIANRFGLKPDQLKALNPGVDPNGIKVGVTKLNVKIQTIHTVGPGDVLRVVAAKYGVSKKSLMEVNHKDQDITLRGEQLIIPLH
ncbi:LysM peptidoglycan-binding domain-containing protein [Cytophagaceae bacterium 50C-KIRBA]|uniref:LysM peptidoglycan-binding domain-containing protein n=1 Tax=Aquirufa beregesia TaxID=2516556 RepID=A0ABX0F2U3_9BACT|nr:LysM peptidoglycan-binding domain-containing protein [Aquirufa beregesia]NGZ44175.1 LysM peptidoglycan-binding domain-containing protein [Aquirufa beregesia]